jgi:hypothetical protein
MLTDNHSAGLCVTCNNATTCVHRQRRGLDALYCELFDDYVEPASAEPHRSAAVAPEPHTILAAGEKDSEFIGLCINCDNRDTCTYPKPEGRIWQCEEYC